MAATAAELVDVVRRGAAVSVEDRHDFGPYNVSRECERLSQGWPLRARDLPPSGRCRFTITTDRGESTCVVGAFLNAAPVEVRRGVDAECADGTVRASRSWLTPVRVRGGEVDWTISRRGLIGWRITDRRGHVLADYRWLRLRIHGDLEPSEAALAIGLIETGVPDSLSLLRWLGNL
jgi:hypothetical protein